MIDTLEKTCPECGAHFRGRIDKKYCSDQCRSAHNNRLHTDTHDYIRRVNYILRRNRRILSELIPQGKNRVTEERLRIKGFDFNHFTSMYTNGEVCYFYCYDIGYMPVEKGLYELMTKESAW